MLKNYLKIAVRNLLKHKVYSFINICGLAVGIGCCLLILLYVNDEISYDKFHKNADNIYRINSDIKFGGNEMRLPLSPSMIGPILKKDYPEVEEYTGIFANTGKLIKRGSDYINERNAAHVDSTFFKVFTFQAISGDLNTALDEPNSVVITETAAKKYFGTTRSIGKILETKDRSNTAYKVTAVIKDMPDGSHFKFDFLFSLENADYMRSNLISHNFYTYLMFKKEADIKDFDKKLDRYVLQHTLPFVQKMMQLKNLDEFKKSGNKIEYSLIPMTRIHLFSNRSFELSTGGNIQYVYIFSAVALFILLIACVNFMNLTTARSANRAREVGIRKALGTDRKKLIFQFLTESTLMALLSVIIAVILIYYALPLFNNITGKVFSINSILTSNILPLLIALPFIVGFIAGIYPAFFLSRFSPNQIMKGKLSSGAKNSSLRSGLVVFQFSASIIMIIGTIIIYKQLDYIRNKNLGFRKENVLIIDNTSALKDNIDAFKNEVLGIPGVTSGTISGCLPVPSVKVDGIFFKEPTRDMKNGFHMDNWPVDYDYLATMGIEMLKGRYFSREFGTDSSATVLNETAARLLGYDNPIGKKIYSLLPSGEVITYNVIGVVKNFHFETLRSEVGPLCFIFGRNTANTSFKINSADVSGIIKQVENKWKAMDTGIPFSYRFLDESFNSMYKTEQNVGLTALVLAIFAVVIASLGLFGLAAYMAEQKTKEIGIRKVLGASFLSIFTMLSSEFLKWVAIANIIAWPVAYYFMNKWLQDFAFRIDISIWMFVISGTAALVIALATVSFQAVKAAVADPVKSLKYE